MQMPFSAYILISQLSALLKRARARGTEDNRRAGPPAAHTNLAIVAQLAKL